jgi:hypothetical protein
MADIGNQWKEWNKILAEIKKFIETNNRNPSHSNLDTNENNLAKWIESHMIIHGELQALINNNSARRGSWDEKYYEYKLFLEKHANPPGFEIETEKPLYIWANNQRQAIRNKLYDKYPERLKLLEAINIHPDLAHSWQTNYLNLLKFIRKNGEFPLPSKQDSLEFELYCWMANQRSCVNRGLYDKYPKRIELLKKINFEKSASRNTSPSWEMMYDKYIEFKILHNREPALDSTEKDEVDLAQWCRKKKNRF